MSQPTQPPSPLDLLFNLVVAFLAPMFLPATAGDLPAARAAAIDTIEVYRAAIAQIIAFGLSALGSLSLAMQDDLPITLTLRLRGNANACNRSAEQNRRALQHTHPATAIPEPSEFLPEPDQDAYEAAVIANVAATQQRLAAAHAIAPKPAPAATPPIPTAQPPATSPDPTERQWQAMWAAAAAGIAAEYAADIPNLPPRERRDASIRAAALSSCANDLLAGNGAPRLTQGALTAIMRAG
jgi:hypothetical protein